MKSPDPPAIIRHQLNAIPLNGIRLAIALLATVVLLCSNEARIANAQIKNQDSPDKVQQPAACTTETSVQGLRKAAALGDVHAMVSLGCLYEHGQGVPNDPVQAMAWYRQAARRGFVPAMNRTGGIYKDGLPRDNGKPHYWLMGPKDDNPAVNSLAMVEFYKGGIHPDSRAAMYWFQRAAKRGSSDAMNDLGEMYIEARGIPRDHDQARQWWTRAAALKNTASMINLGNLYLGGWGVPKDTEKAIGLYEQAGAFEKLGELYQSGRGVPADQMKAIEYFEKGANLDDPGSMNALAYLYSGENDATHQRPRDFTKAKYLYERLASTSETAGSDEWARRGAMGQLAESYESGIFTEQNYQTAMQWYRKLAMLNEPFGMDGVANLYSRGLGTPKDEAEAQKWNARAAALRPPPKTPDCTDQNLETKLRVFTLLGSQVVALERRNKTSATCALGRLELKPNEVAHTSRRWRTLSSDGTDASCKSDINNSFLEGILLVSPTLLPQVCSEVQSSGYAAGPFIPDWPAGQNLWPVGRDQVLSPELKLTLAATKQQYMKREYVPLHVEMTGADAATPRSKQSCPVLLRFVTKPSGSTRIDEMTPLNPVAGERFRMVKSCSGIDISAAQSAGFDFDGTDQMDESTSSTIQFFTLAGESPSGEVRLVGSNSIPIDFKDPAEMPRTWGAVKEGVHVDLSLDKLTYDVGEDIPLHIAAQVVSNEHPVYWGPFHLTIIGEDGVIVGNEEPANLEETWLMGGGPSFCPSPLVVGTVHPLERSAKRLGLLLNEPGTYRITVSWSPYPEPNPPCRESGGVTNQGPVQPLVTVASAPITIHITGAPVAERGVPDFPVYTGWKEHFRVADTSMGEATAIEDLRSHLQWLRLSLTKNQSTDSLRKQMETGGRLAGWRSATRTEVIAFFANLPGSADGRSTDPGIERALQHLLGGPTDVVVNPDTGWSRRATYAAALGDIRQAKQGDAPSCVGCVAGYTITFAYIGEDTINGHIDVTVNPATESWNSGDQVLWPGGGGGFLLVRNAQ